jgi:hypothetical protein
VIRLALVTLVTLGSACAFDDKIAAPPPLDDDPGGKGDDGDPSGVPWSVSRHVFPEGWGDDTRARVSQDLALIAELGATYVRTDVWWFAVEPKRGQFDTTALAYYRWYVEEAAKHGLGVVTILSNAPDWARALYDANHRAELAADFGRYAERVTETLGDLVTYYQLWNEPNHINDFPDGDTDIQLFRAGRDGIVRGRATLGVTHPFRTVVNVLVDGHDGPLGGRWEDDLRYFLDHGARDAIDVLAIDHYPGTWSVGDWGGNILDRLFTLGAEEGKRVAIFEAGYATSHCTLPLNTEAGQVAWVREQVPRIRSKAANRDLALVNWFKLDDRNTGNCFDPEDNFGIVRTDRSKKPAFDALKAEIKKF